MTLISRSMRLEGRSFQSMWLNYNIQLRDFSQKASKTPELHEWRIPLTSREMEPLIDALPLMSVSRLWEEKEKYFKIRTLEIPQEPRLPSGREEMNRLNSFYLDRSVFLHSGFLPYMHDAIPLTQRLCTHWIHAGSWEMVRMLVSLMVSYPWSTNRHH